MQRILHVAVLVVSLLVTLWPATVHAAGRLEGRLTRPDGTPLAGVTVILGHTGDTVITDAQGRYAFPAVPNGSVTLTFVLGARSSVVGNMSMGDTTVTLDHVLDWTSAMPRRSPSTAHRAALSGSSRRRCPFPGP